MSEPVIRVLVADDHAIVRTGIRHVLEGEPGFAVVGEAATGAEALDLAERLRPDVAVLDLSMPGGSGLRVAAELRRLAPETHILILSMHDNAEYVIESLRAGAHGYLLKDAAATELRGAIRAVRRGESFFSPAIAGRLGAVLRGEPGEPRSPAVAQLSARERQVLVGVAQGRTNREIALELGISHRTVETHRESLMRKLGVRTVAGLTRLALEAGLIGP
jgi:DNA-binding NarL/FixJ family response regulator